MSKPDFTCKVDCLTFQADTLPEALTKLSDHLKENPNLALDHHYIGPIDVKYDKDDEVFRVSCFGDAY